MATNRPLEIGGIPDVPDVSLALVPVFPSPGIKWRIGGMAKTRIKSATTPLTTHTHFRLANSGIWIMTLCEPLLEMPLRDIPDRDMFIEFEPCKSARISYAFW